MSTKIYDAYTYSGSLYELVRYLTKLRAAKIRSFVGELAGGLHQEPPVWGALKTDIEALLASGLRAGKVSDFYLSNPASSAVVYAAKVRRKEVVLVQFFGLDAFVPPKQRFRDFHYQNQTDSDLNAKELATRKRTWSAVFRASQTPREAGFSFPIIEKDDAWKVWCMLFSKIHGHAMGEPNGCERCAKREKAQLTRV